MYFPPYEQLLTAASRSVADNRSAPSVTIPKKLFDFLLQAALTTAQFDEKSYLDQNPDIKAGLGRGNELTAHQHYIGYGYFEGRHGGGPKVEEAWYLKTYPDVASAVKSGAAKSAADHFEIAGASEGRAPSQGSVPVAQQWKDLLTI
jgi:hypothetical protein